MAKTKTVTTVGQGSSVVSERRIEKIAFSYVQVHVKANLKHKEQVALI